MKMRVAAPVLVFAALWMSPAVALAATAPTITSQPDIALVGEAGGVTQSSAQFSAHAEGTPAPTVRWQVAPDRNGPWSDVTGSPKVTTTTLVVPASAENLGDAYRAVFTNSAGTTISRPAKLVSRADWMSNLGSDIENVPLNELTIPGAHDMGTYGFTKNSPVSLDGQLSDLDCVSKSVCDSYGRAQDPSNTGAEMLVEGIRYFDLLVCGNNTAETLEVPENWPEFSTNPVTCHGLNGALLAPILKDTREFAIAHPKEVVMLDVNHEYQVELDALAKQIEDAFALPGGKSLMIAPQYCEAGALNSGECASQLTLGKIWQGHLGNVIVNFENDNQHQKSHTTVIHYGPNEQFETFNLQPTPNYAFYNSFPNLWGRLNESPLEEERCTKSSATTSCFGNTTSRYDANYWVKNTLETRASFSDTRHFFVQFLQTTPTSGYILNNLGGSLKDMAVSPEIGSNPIIGPALFECTGGEGSCFGERRPENINILALNFYDRTEFPSVDEIMSEAEVKGCTESEGPCDLTAAEQQTVSCVPEKIELLQEVEGPGCYYTKPVNFDLIEQAIRFDEYARTPPVVAVSSPSTPSANGWYNAATLGQGNQLQFAVSAHDYGYPTGLGALSCLDGSSPVSLRSIVPTAASSTTGFGSLSDGVHSIECQASDGANEGFHHAGNSGAGPGSSPSAVFKVDTHAPTVTTRQLPVPNEAGWTRSNATVVWFWTDKGGSGIEPANCTTSSTSSGEGPITLNASCQDVAGNAATASRTIKVDKIAPTASPTQVPSANGAGWNPANVKVNWNWTDEGGSGIEPANCTTSSTSSGEGTVTLNATCQDVAGNVGTASYTVKVDKIAPTASPTQVPSANGAGWNRGNVTVNWNWTDKGGSGIEPANCTTWSTSSGEGTVTLNASCQDVAGNVATASYTVKVDKTPPTAAPTALPPANGAGWNRGNVTVNWNWTDKGGSGIEPANCTTSSTSSVEGTITLNASCQDVAGNVGTASYTLKVDKVAPTVTYAGNAGTYSLLAAVAITCTPADGLSGVASSTCANASGPAWSYGAGSHTLSATATDVAGNVGSGSATFTVTVSSAELSTLTRQLVDGSAKYQSQAALSRTVIDSTVGVDCTPLTLINSKTSAALKQALVASYKLSIQTLTLSGWLSSAQVAILGNLAGAL
jgi:hypothetical protein